MILLGIVAACVCNIRLLYLTGIHMLKARVLQIFAFQLLLCELWKLRFLLLLAVLRIAYSVCVFCLQPRKVAVPILAPLPFVSATAADISVLTTHMKIDALASSVPSKCSPKHDLYSSWPTVGATERPRIDAPKPKPVQENKVHDIIMRYFAKQFIPMDSDELMALKLEDLEIIM